MPTPTAGRGRAAGTSNARVEAARTAEMDERAFTDLCGQGCPRGVRPFPASALHPARCPHRQVLNVDHLSHALHAIRTMVCFWASAAASKWRGRRQALLQRSLNHLKMREPGVGVTLEDVAFAHPAVRFQRPRIVRSPRLAGGYVGALHSGPGSLAGVSKRSWPAVCKGP